MAILTLGITGGLASGKSAVAHLMAVHGATVFSADEAARAVVVPQGAVLAELKRVFGPSILHRDGFLDRAALSHIIFTDSAARDRVNRVLHPPILRLLRDQIDAARYDLSFGSVIAVEAPLLFEAGMQYWFERIVVVTASESTQIARLKQRNDLNEAEARLRLAAQWPIQDKIARADYVVKNEGSPAQLARSVEILWKQLCIEAGRNIGI